MLLIMKRLKMSSTSTETPNTHHPNKGRGASPLEFDLWSCLGLSRRLKEGRTMETEHSSE